MAVTAPQNRPTLATYRVVNMYYWNCTMRTTAHRETELRLIETFVQAKARLAEAHKSLDAEKNPTARISAQTRVTAMRKAGAAAAMALGLHQCGGKG